MHYRFREALCKSWMFSTVDRNTSTVSAVNSVAKNWIATSWSCPQSCRCALGRSLIFQPEKQTLLFHWSILKCYFAFLDKVTKSRGTPCGKGEAALSPEQLSLLQVWYSCAYSDRWSRVTIPARHLEACSKRRNFWEKPGLDVHRLWSNISLL